MAKTNKEKRNHFMLLAAVFVVILTITKAFNHEEKSNTINFNIGFQTSFENVTSIPTIISTIIFIAAIAYILSSNTQEYFDKNNILVYSITAILFLIGIFYTDNNLLSKSDLGSLGSFIGGILTPISVFFTAYIYDKESKEKSLQHNIQHYVLYIETIEEQIINDIEKLKDIENTKVVPRYYTKKITHKTLSFYRKHITEIYNETIGSPNKETNDKKVEKIDKYFPEISLLDKRKISIKVRKLKIKLLEYSDAKKIFNANYDHYKKL